MTQHSLLPNLNKRVLGSRPLSLQELSSLQKEPSFSVLSASEIATFLHKTSSPENDTPAFIPIEAFIQLLVLTAGEIEAISAVLRPKTTPPQKDWDWLHIGQSEAYYYRIRLLRVLLLKTADLHNTPEDCILGLLETLSYHANPHLPWTSLLTCTIVTSCLETESIAYFAKTLNAQFLQLLRPQLLSLLDTSSRDMSLSNPKLSAAGYSSKRAAGLLNGGLRPKLGFSGINENISEEDLRQQWKTSSNVRSLSMIWYLICVSKNNPQLDTYWPLITSFILNVLDDHQPLFKAQGCLLLDNFLQLPNLRNKQDSHLLVRSGLLELFTTSTKMCLAFIPLLTPPEQSRFLLQIAYPVLYLLIDLKEDKDVNVEYGDIVTANILTSVSHLRNSLSDEETENIVVFLIDQLDSIIRKHLGPGILICLSRVNSAINLIIVDPLISGAKKGLGEHCLGVQKTILGVFEHLKDPSAASLVESYKYDFLGCWALFLRRNGVSEMVLQNFQSLRSILAQIEGAVEQLDLDVQRIQEQHPAVKFV